MNIAIISIFRNATHYLERYFEQMDNLQTLLWQRGDTLRLLLGYGDSHDGTGEALFDECSNRFCATLMDVSHGGREFGSIVHPDRFRQLAYCGNKLLDAIPESTDVVGIVESDLIWDAETIVSLIDHIQDYVAVAPMIMDGEASFYDIYAFRKNGVRFTKKPPYHPELNRDFVQVDSAGSVLFMDAYLARKARLTDGEAIVGFCYGINREGGSIWCDTTLTVKHPPYGRGQESSSSSARNSDNLRVPS